MIEDLLRWKPNIPANVGDFAIRIIVPTLNWNGVSDRFA